ncbi:LytR C-terminal domain-containing protein [Granulicoccus sp. GXG6511]|uniref:LytR C-terminal domain-containing protein n=1 Tax=Granulicoccus sp. GXG6511 TaxID=3381351 RepID=UPI003D7CCBBE
MDYGRIWRIAKTPVILLSLLALVAVAWFWGYRAVTAPLPPPYVAPCVEQPVPDGKLKSEMISVRVLNASNKRGKAAEVSQQLKRQGFKVTRVGNADENQAKSVVIGGSADSPEVELVAAQFSGFETEGDNRKDRSVEVRIGQNYESMIGDAPTELQIDGTTICLPQAPTAAPV